MPRNPQKNTKEMVALWSAAVEEKLAGILAPVLGRLALRSGAALSTQQARDLSHPLARALQIAAARGGGARAAIDYLSETAGEAAGGDPIAPSRR